MQFKCIAEEMIYQKTQELVGKLNKIINDDLQYWIENGYYERDELSICFYTNDPFHYSIRADDKIISDRWLVVEFLVNGK